ncbi:4'-phosphopantetheinyl transferase superfamily protein [Crenobacter sp. SG2303]|uniref:4'-phosphopantetheinyl transferase superfamily protein n=1 Tax=Crenobacter oryzisoli TaxID=3056844 RepID=A0ABT7XPJ5_9NEIS|nr:4'-phosphopantetheinyl transferase superfamily protein [Crenobacter sp. SG2303]MDN0075723.1 4'-phosphopantetheinyl transferase superfamily protein [Crenobacter sp. SG2303]
MAALNWWLPPATLAERGVCAGWLSLPGSRMAQREAVRRELPVRLAEPFGQTSGSLRLVETETAPRLQGLVGAQWLSLSYAGERIGFALAARPVGIDLVEVGALPDWREVAEDFFGPNVTSELLAHPGHEQTAAFALAWVELEARGKALGEGLAEWDAARAARLARTELAYRNVADGYAVALALRG